MVSQNLLFTGNGKITSDPFSPIPPVNRARIDAFTLGDKAEEALLIGMFIEQAEENLTLLTLYMQENREAQWRQRAHRFMGLAGSMGALVFSPVLLFFTDIAGKISLRRRITVIVPLVIVFLSGLVFFNYIRKVEAETIRREFDQYSNTLAQAVERHMHSMMDAVYVIRSFFAGSSHSEISDKTYPEYRVSRREFHDFTRHLFSRYPSIHALAWLPNVPEHKRNFYEQFAGKDGLKDFHFTDRTLDGHFIPAARRSWYFPTYFLEPVVGAEMLLGFDAASIPSRMSNITKAASSGNIVISQRIQLLLDSKDQYSFAIFVPLYPRDIDNTDRLTEIERMQRLEGVAVGAFRVNEAIKTALEGLDRQDIYITMEDVTNIVPSERLLYSDNTEKQPPFQWMTDFPMGDRTWRITFTPTATYLKSHQDWDVWLVLLGAMMFTSLLGMFLLVVTGKTATIQKRVALRTQELHDATAQLKQYAGDLEAAMTEAKYAKEQAEEATHLKSEFLAMMSHEIRTPMNGIFGMAELMLETDLTGKQKAHMHTLMSSAEALLIIIDDILDFSKIEAGKLELEPIGFDLRALVEGVAELYAVKAHEKAVELVVDYSPDMEQYFIGDPVRIRQIITNLVSNAIKFTEKGVIKLDARPLSANEARQEKYGFQISVTDSGIGIPPEAQGRIFDKFSQADTSTTRKFGGTGLGLAICKQLTAMMGGDIGVISEPGKGSCFWFTLMLEQNREVLVAEDATSAVDIASTQFKGIRILLAEDNRINQMFAKEMLETMGCLVEVADNGLQAVEKIGQQPFDMVMMDCQMPEMDGFEATAHIRKMPPPAMSIPIIALTANAMKGDKERCMEAGMSDYISKPIRKQNLQEMLAKWGAAHIE